MKTITPIIVLLVVSASFAAKPNYSLSQAPALYVKFMEDNHRQFNSTYDLLVHYDEYVKSLKAIIEFNATSGPNLYRDPSVFADRTEEEVWGTNKPKVPSDA